MRKKQPIFDGLIAFTKEEIAEIKEAEYNRGYDNGYKKAKEIYKAKKEAKKSNKAKVKTADGETEELRKNVVDGE